MTTTTWICLLLGALAVGVLVGWLVAANRSGAARRSADIELARGHAEIEGLRREAAGLREQLDLVRDEAERRVAEARADAERRLQALKEESEQRLRAVKEDQEAERQRFQSVAGQALAANSQQFLELAQQTLKASTVKNEEVLVQREQAFKALVEPLSKAVEKVREEVAEAEKARIEGHSTLSEHLRRLAEANAELHKGTSDLVTALRSSQTRGAWGELQLRRVVEAAGMLQRVDFTEQAQVSTDDGLLRPDMVVHLAGGKSVVVDSKVAFLGYLEAQQATDEDYRQQRLDAHVRHMRKHVDDLAAKKYWDQFSPAPEFVVMFVPAEAFLSAAVEREPDLLEYAARKNVIVATPMTMVALLRTVAYAWRQDALAENAQKVLTVGKELYSRLVTMTGHITKTGRALESATKSYNSMIGSLERNVLTSARRMVELDVVDEKDDIEEVKGIEEVPRPITKPELLAAEEERVVAIDTVSVTERTATLEQLVAADQRALDEAADRAADDEVAAG
ncbi:DNA recombination protein RmuC [Xylanimonas oleitrophica]|uniref:DNA recombination protein RmuC n=1 Tax=Xylanimonas oleitrophica TaxID=2607479 RepID=A0A2W5WWQ5_9MICO|nr:DNA recombination protein RmuC [Xylanimonas oleitrophica]PZR55053.1 DNA recombination protein RmuC [Xylanimonas oleitrophica]